MVVERLDGAVVGSRRGSIHGCPPPAEVTLNPAVAHQGTDVLPMPFTALTLGSAQEEVHPTTPRPLIRIVAGPGVVADDGKGKGLGTP